MSTWFASHVEVVVMCLGCIGSFMALLWRGASDTQKVLGRLDMVGYRLGEVEKSVQIGSEGRAKLHGRIDDVGGRVVVLETKVGAS